MKRKKNKEEHLCLLLCVFFLGWGVDSFFGLKNE